MATRIAWWLNFDADVELADPARTRPALSAEQTQTLRARMADLIADHDVLLGADVLPADDCVVQAFCPTPSALSGIQALGLPPMAAPAFSVLRAVNDRAFCAALGQTLSQARYVTDMTELLGHLEARSPTGMHVIKRAFSFAGREQRRVKDSMLDASTRGFCERSFERGQGLQVEPWVDRVADFSRHAYLAFDGSCLIGDTRQQRIDELGRFLGMSSAPADITVEEDTQLAAEVHAVASALHAAGYFGPFGIDAFRYRDNDGTLRLNPRCEINARFTMGYPRALLLDALHLSP